MVASVVMAAVTAVSAPMSTAMTSAVTAVSPVAAASAAAGIGFGGSDAACDQSDGQRGNRKGGFRQFAKHGVILDFWQMYAIGDPGLPLPVVTVFVSLLCPAKTSAICYKPFF